MTAIDDAFLALKDIHKDCLRLAIYHYSSKEIGRKLGISRHTADQRLYYSMKLLGASSRFEAARMLADYEAGEKDNPTPHPFVYKPPYVSRKPKAVSDTPSVGERDGRSGKAAYRLNDAQAPYAFDDKLSTFHPVSFMEEPKPKLSLAQKAVWIVAIATASLFAFVAAIAGLEVLSRIQ